MDKAAYFGTVVIYDRKMFKKLLLSRGINVIKKFPLSLTTRQNKPEGLPLVTLSNRVLEFEGKAKQTQLEDLLNACLLGKLLVLPTNVRPDWTVFARCKHSSLFGLVSNEEKSLITTSPSVNVIKHFFFVADDEAKKARVFVPGNYFQV